MHFLVALGLSMQVCLAREACCLPRLPLGALHLGLLPLHAAPAPCGPQNATACCPVRTVFLPPLPQRSSLAPLAGVWRLACPIVIFICLPCSILLEST